jgi:hypothetical protein
MSVPSIALEFTELRLRFIHERKEYPVTQIIKFYSVPIYLALQKILPDPEPYVGELLASVFSRIKNNHRQLPFQHGLVCVFPDTNDFHAHLFFDANTLLKHYVVDQAPVNTDYTSLFIQLYWIFCTINYEPTLFTFLSNKTTSNGFFYDSVRKRFAAAQQPGMPGASCLLKMILEEYDKMSADDFLRIQKIIVREAMLAYNRVKCEVEEGV